jgi:hypothetical protein
VLTLAQSEADVAAALTAARGAEREALALLAPSCELFGGDDGVPRRVAAAPACEPASAAIGTRLAAFAIEAVLVADDSPFARLVASHAAALGIPVVTTAAQLRAAVDPHAT